MFGSRKREEDAARIAGLVKLVGLHEDQHKRFAAAIDELERRNNNLAQAANAAIAGVAAGLQTVNLIAREAHARATATGEAVEGIATQIRNVIAETSNPSATRAPPPASTPAAVASPPSMLAERYRAAELQRRRETCSHVWGYGGGDYANCSLCDAYTTDLSVVGQDAESAPIEFAELAAAEAAPMETTAVCEHEFSYVGWADEWQCSKCGNSTGEDPHTAMSFKDHVAAHLALRIAPTVAK